MSNIDREKAISEIQGLTIVDSSVRAYADAVLGILQDAPDSKNAERIGHWIWQGKDRGPICSECGSKALLNYESDWCDSDFCPHCGAKMA